VIILVGIATGSLTVLIARIIVAGVGQGVAYLGARELLDGVVPADRRGAVMSVFFLVLYLAAALAALAVSSAVITLREVSK
jgi:sugar phosphate permease